MSRGCSGGMLVLARTASRSIYIGRDVTITVLKIKPNGIAEIGIDAPLEWAIDARRVTVVAGRRVVDVGMGDEFTLRGIFRIVINSVSVDGVVKLAIDSPRHLAITRDDFSLEQHLRHQDHRDRKAARP